MTIEFRFNGSHQVILVPENNKDKQLIQLFVGGNTQIRMVPPPSSMPEALIMESFVVELKAAESEDHQDPL